MTGRDRVPEDFRHRQPKRTGSTNADSSRRMPTGRGVVLAAIAAALTATALLAIGILLLGNFGPTEGRILATTGLLAAYGLLTLPAAVLFDQARLRSLSLALLALAAAGFVLALTTVWWADAPQELAKSMGTLTVFAVALAQTAALSARRRERDPTSVRRLLVLSSGLSLVLATMISTASWAELDYALYFRVLGSLAVLDVLVVALQPLLAFARPAGALHHLRLLVEPDDEIETTILAADFATAAAKAIRTVERSERRVLRLERIEETLTVSSGSSAPSGLAARDPGRRPQNDALRPRHEERDLLRRHD